MLQILLYNLLSAAGAGCNGGASTYAGRWRSPTVYRHHQGCNGGASTYAGRWRSPTVYRHHQWFIIQAKNRWTSISWRLRGIWHHLLQIVDFCSVTTGAGSASCFHPAHEVLHEWYPAQLILSPANIQGGEFGAACSIVEQWHSVALHDSIRSHCDGHKGADETQR